MKLMTAENVSRSSGPSVRKRTTERTASKLRLDFESVSFPPKACATEITSRKIATLQRAAEAVANCESNLPARYGHKAHKIINAPSANPKWARSRKFAN